MSAANAARPAWAEQVAAGRRAVTRRLQTVPLPAPHHAAGTRKHSLRIPVTATLVLIGVVIAQLLLSIAVSADAYTMQGLKDKQVTLERQLSEVNGDLQRMASPTHLSSDAVAIGMVPSGSPVFIRLSDGAVLGSPEPAKTTPVQGNLVPNANLAGVPLITAKLAAQGASVVNH